VGTQELVLRTRNGGAVGLVSAIHTVPVTITVVGQRDTEGVGTSELAPVTSGEIAALFITVVPAVVAMVTLEEGLYAASPVSAAELRDAAGHPVVLPAVLLISPIAAVQVAITVLLLW